MRHFPRQSGGVRFRTTTHSPTGRFGPQCSVLRQRVRKLHTISVAAAAINRLTVRGEDLVGAHLVTQGDPDYPVHIATPKGLKVPEE